MADEIGALRVALSADHAKITGDLARARAAVNTFANRTRVAMATVGKSFSGAAGGLRGLSTFTTIGAVTGLGAFLKKSIDTAEQMNALAQKVGITTESMSALAFAAQQSEMQVDDLVKGLRFLNKATGEAATGSKEAREGFAAFGLSVADLRDATGKLKPADQILMELARRWEVMPSFQEKAAAATKLFGRGYAELIPLLNQGATGIDQLTARAATLGVVVSTSAGRAADDFNDQVAELWATVSGFGISLATKFLPGINNVITAFREARAAGKDWWETLQALHNSALGPVGKAQFDVDAAARAVTEAQQRLATTEQTPLLAEGARRIRIARAQAALDAAWERYRTAEAELNRVQAAATKQAADEQAAAKKQQDLLDEILKAREELLAQIEAEGEKVRSTTDQVLEAGEQAIEALLRERDVREGTSRVAQLAFELEAGNLAELHRLRLEGTADERKQAAAIEDRLGALARELDLRQVIQGIEDATATRMQDSADRAAQIVEAGKTEADNLREQLKELEALHKRLPTSLLVGGGLGDEALLSDEQYEQARKRLQMMLDAAVAAERLEARQKALNAGVADGTVTHEQYRAAVAASRAEMEGAATAIIERWDLVDRTFEDWSQRATDALVRFAMTGKLAFGDFARSVIADLLRIQIQAEMTSLFRSMSASGAGSFVGGLFSGGALNRATPLAPMVPGSEVAAKPVASMAEVAGYGMSELRSAAKLASRGVELEGQAAAPAGAAPVNLRVVNLSDRDQVPGWVSTSPGERAILNVIGRNATQLKTILRT